MTSEINDFWFHAEDGLKLHALSASLPDSASLPAVCLPGISRTAEDFRELIGAFAENRPHSRPAFALNSRGRGLSQHDRNPANYSIAVELNDLVTFLQAINVRRAIFVGTSRGGILTMALASIFPQMIAGAVLNDVGPVFEMQGLLRIKNYVGKMPRPRSWPEAVTQLKKIMGAHFSAFSDGDWESYARRTWSGNFEPLSDPAISTALAQIDPAVPLPTLWPQFDALTQASPVLVLRGEHSDLLSRATVAEMKRRAKSMEVVEIAGQGHAPALGGAAIETVLDFADRCGQRERS
jgi:pimeloyl-ACP methyl ester carboxylesterase